MRRAFPISRSVRSTTAKCSTCNPTAHAGIGGLCEGLPVPDCGKPHIMSAPHRGRTRDLPQTEPSPFLFWKGERGFWGAPPVPPPRGCRPSGLPTERYADFGRQVLVLVSEKATRIFLHPPVRFMVWGTLLRRFDKLTTGFAQGRLGPSEPFRGWAVGCVNAYARKHQHRAINSTSVPALLGLYAPVEVGISPVTSH